MIGCRPFHKLPVKWPKVAQKIVKRCPKVAHFPQKLPNYGKVAQMLPAKRLTRGHPQCEYRLLKLSEFSACYVCSDIITDHELLDNITIINELCQLESISPHFIITTQQKHQQNQKICYMSTCLIVLACLNNTSFTQHI